MVIEVTKLVEIAPNLDCIPLPMWFKQKYDFKQEEEIENLIKNHVWVTARKLLIPVKEMTTSHIKNCIKCWEGKGRMHIPPNYLGGKEKWLKIFNQELINRQ